MWATGIDGCTNHLLKINKDFFCQVLFCFRNLFMEHQDVRAVLKFMMCFYIGVSCFSYFSVDVATTEFVNSAAMMSYSLRELYVHKARLGGRDL